MTDLLAVGPSIVNNPGGLDACFINSRDGKIKIEKGYAPFVVHIAPQDIDAYLNGGEMPSLPSSETLPSTSHLDNTFNDDQPAQDLKIFNQIVRQIQQHVCNAQFPPMRLRAKPTASLPWHLFRRPRPFWSSSDLARKPSQLSQAKIERAVRPLRFGVVDLLGNRVTLEEVLKEHFEPPITIRVAKARASESITYIDLLHDQLADTRKGLKNSALREDYNAMFMSPHWAQGKTFDRTQEAARQRVREIVSATSKATPSDSSKCSQTETPATTRINMSATQRGKRKAESVCEDETASSTSAKRNVGCLY